MNNIQNELNDIMVNITVRCMLNPKNKHFYLGSMKLHEIVEMFNTIPEEIRDNAISCFWTAYAIASVKYNAEQKEVLQTIKDIDDIICVIDEQLEKCRQSSCPECGCTDTLGYVSGIKCPNCDAEEN